MSILLQVIEILPYDWNQNWISFRFCSLIFQIVYFSVSSYIKPHKFVKTPDCFLFPYLPWMMYWMLQMKHFDPFHAFT